MKIDNCKNDTKETDKIVFKELEKADELYKKYEQINQTNTLTDINNNIDEDYDTYSWEHPLSIYLARIF